MKENTKRKKNNKNIQKNRKNLTWWIHSSQSFVHLILETSWQCCLTKLGLTRQEQEFN